MDLEGHARRFLSHPDIAYRLADRILEWKAIPRESAIDLAEAVLAEVRATEQVGPPLRPEPSGVTMGRFGVGSRGAGDQFVHRKIAEVIGPARALLGARDLDDAGVVRVGRGSPAVAVAVDGIHSRLSDFPLLAGFHAARAAVRDLYVTGAAPVALFSDLHLADDGDVAKLFDFVAGVAALGKAARIPYVSGSTLRIGGDVVIGDRLSGGVGAVGVVKRLLPRRAARPGDLLLMTEGAGGGTISATALYHGKPEVVEETLNIRFAKAAEALLKSPLLARVRAMLDVTNGGIRGDAAELARAARARVVIQPGEFRRLVNRRVLALLEELEIDPLGVSVDSLLVAAPPAAAERVRALWKRWGVASGVVGRLERGSGAFVEEGGKVRPLGLKFRESAYTPVKKAVGEAAPADLEVLRAKVESAARRAAKRRDWLAATARGR
jgi:hydrogenase expression/formation protein